MSNFNIEIKKEEDVSFLSFWCSEDPLSPNPNFLQTLKNLHIETSVEHDIDFGSTFLWKATKRLGNIEEETDEEIFTRVILEPFLEFIEELGFSNSYCDQYRLDEFHKDYPNIRIIIPNMVGSKWHEIVFRVRGVEPNKLEFMVYATVLAGWDKRQRTNRYMDTNIQFTAIVEYDTLFSQYTIDKFLIHLDDTIKKYSA